MSGHEPFSAEAASAAAVPVGPEGAAAAQTESGLVIAKYELWIPDNLMYAKLHRYNLTEGDATAPTHKVDIYVSTDEALEANYPARVPTLVEGWSTVNRLAKLNMEIRPGNLTDRERLDEIALHTGGILSSMVTFLGRTGDGS
jgi:hypothetical protein